jgi:hypothetical protein
VSMSTFVWFGDLKEYEERNRSGPNFGEHPSGEDPTSVSSLINRNRNLIRSFKFGTAAVSFSYFFP